MCHQAFPLPSWFMVLSMVLIAAGCGGEEPGPEKFTVTGTVAVDGGPLEQGRIQFRSRVDGRAFVGRVEDGQYLLETEAGDMSVEITASRATGKFDEGASPDDDPQPVMEMYIPEEYNSKTTLTAMVTPDGENAFSFDVELE